MKILVLSDTHAYLENARAVLARLQGKVDAVFHLGDHDDDAVALQQEFPKLPFHYVKGNNDYRVDTPSQKLVRLGGKTLLLTHGHKQRVYWNYDTISYWAEEQGADVVLFGHTHMPLWGLIPSLIDLRFHKFTLAEPEEHDCRQTCAEGADINGQHIHPTGNNALDTDGNNDANDADGKAGRHAGKVEFFL